jgi:hypothetical protein
MLVLVAAEYLPHSHQGHLDREARPRHRADSPANDCVTEVFGVIRQAGVEPREPLPHFVTRAPLRLGELRACSGDLVLEAAEFVCRVTGVMTAGLDADVVTFGRSAQRTHRGLLPRNVFERVE